MALRQTHSPCTIKERSSKIKHYSHMCSSVHESNVLKHLSVGSESLNWCCSYSTIAPSSWVLCSIFFTRSCCAITISTISMLRQTTQNIQSMHMTTANESSKQCIISELHGVGGFHYSWLRFNYLINITHWMNNFFHTHTSMPETQEALPIATGLVLCVRSSFVTFSATAASIFEPFSQTYSGTAISTFVENRLWHFTSIVTTLLSLLRPTWSGPVTRSTAGLCPRSAAVHPLHNRHFARHRQTLSQYSSVRRRHSDLHQHLCWRRCRGRSPWCVPAVDVKAWLRAAMTESFQDTGYVAGFKFPADQARTFTRFMSCRHKFQFRTRQCGLLINL